MPGYWNADSDRDWQDSCGMYDGPSPYLDRPCRSLDEYLAELVAEYEGMPEYHNARRRLAERIRAVETELLWRIEL